MLDALARILAHVGNDPVAAVAAQVLAQLGDGGKDMAQQSPILFGQGSSRCDMLLGNDEEVNRRLGVDVIKGQQLVILVQLVGGNFPAAIYSG